MARDDTIALVRRERTLRNEYIRARELQQSGANLNAVFGGTYARLAGYTYPRDAEFEPGGSNGSLLDAGQWGELITLEHVNNLFNGRLEIWVLGQDCDLTFEVDGAAFGTAGAGSSYDWHQTTFSDNFAIGDQPFYIELTAIASAGTTPRLRAWAIYQQITSAGSLP